MRFNLNDYVRVKPGVLLEETGEPVPGWEGEITEVPQNPLEDVLYLVELDAPSLENLPERFLAECIENEEIPIAHYFTEDDLEPAVRRDTDTEREQAQDRIEAIIFPPEAYELNSAQVQQWLTEYEQHPLFFALKPEEQESARSIVESFADLAFNYIGDQPDDWTTTTVREVCLELFPQKFTAEIEFFARIGPILSGFFGFLAEQNYPKNASALRREVQRIASDIVRRAKDPRNWGISKGIAMQAIEAGVDLADENALSQFITAYNANRLNQTPLGRGYPSQYWRPAPENPFKHLSRNQVITVQYTDGSIRDGKFKRLEADLQAGKCSLVE